MATNLPKSSAAEPVEPAEQTGVFRRPVRGGTGAISISPVPPATTAVPSADPLPADCSTGERFTLVLQAVPDPGGAPAITRLRRFLKMALRSYGLRCDRIESATESAADGLLNPSAPVDKMTEPSRVDTSTRPLTTTQTYKGGSHHG
jgi:hypothetical protein